MVEDPGPEAAIVGHGYESHTRAQAGTQDAQSLKPLRLKPIQAGPGVDDGLAVGVDGSSDIAGAVVIRALECPGHPPVVVSETHAQCADSKAVEQLAEAH